MAAECDRPVSSPPALQVRAHGGGLPFVHVALDIALPRTGSRGLAPMVEHAGQMSDPRRVFGHAQQKFVVLHAIEGRIKPAGGPGHRGADAQHMAGIHHAEQEFRREVRLEERVHALAVGRDGVLVGIERIEFGLTFQPLGQFAQGVGSEQIVVVEQDDEFTGRHGEGEVGGPGDASVGRTRLDPDPFIPGGIKQDAGHVRRAGTVVHDTEFPVRIMLPLHGIEAGAQERRRRVEHREQNGKERAAGRDVRGGRRVGIAAFGPRGIVTPRRPAARRVARLDGVERQQRALDRCGGEKQRGVLALQRDGQLKTGH